MASKNTNRNLTKNEVDTIKSKLKAKDKTFLNYILSLGDKNFFQLNNFLKCSEAEQILDYFTETSLSEVAKNEKEAVALDLIVKFFGYIYAHRVVVKENVHPGLNTEREKQLIVRANYISYKLRSEIEKAFCFLLRELFDNKKEADFAYSFNKLIVALGPLMPSKKMAMTMSEILDRFTKDLNNHIHQIGKATAVVEAIGLFSDEESIQILAKSYFPFFNLLLRESSNSSNASLYIVGTTSNGILPATTLLRETKDTTAFDYKLLLKFMGNIVARGEVLEAVYCYQMYEELSQLVPEDDDMLEIKRKLQEKQEKAKRIEILFNGKVKPMYFATFNVKKEKQESTDIEMKNKEEKEEDSHEILPEHRECNFYQDSKKYYEIRSATKILLSGCNTTNISLQQQDFLSGASQIVKLAHRQKMYYYHPIKWFIPRIDEFWTVLCFALLAIINVLVIYENSTISDLPEGTLRGLAAVHFVSALLMTIAFCLDWSSVLIPKFSIADIQRIQQTILFKNLARKLVTLIIYCIISIISIWNPLLLTVNVFFALSLLPLQTAFDIFSSFIQRIGQVTLTFVIGLSAAYGLTGIGFTWLRSFYEFSDGGPLPWNNLARTLLYSLDFGLRSSPVPDAIYTDRDAGTAIGTFIFNLSYQFTIVFVFAAIISGIIVDQFGQIRQRRQERKDLNKRQCFICGIDREEFDKMNVGFKIHTTCEHNPVDYLAFFHYLYNIQATKFWELDALENHCKAMFENGEFWRLMPTKRALCLEAVQPKSKSSDIKDSKKEEGSSVV